MRPLAALAAALALATACAPPHAPLHSAAPPVAPTPPTTTIRVVSAPHIRVVSMLDPTRDLSGLPPETAALPAPHRGPLPLPSIHAPADLRRLVGLRDKREPAAAIAALGDMLEGTADLLVFDHTDSDREGDLTALAIATDPRGVIEFLYLAGGVYRRGFVDPAHPDKRRDRSGAVLNTFMRTGKRWPPKGTHYLAGELLAHVIRAR